MSREYEDLQKSSTSGILAQAYHANGVCGSQESKVGTFLTAFWKEHVIDSRVANPAPVGAPYTYDNTKFLRMLKRCIQLRTRSLHTYYQTERLNLLRDVINGTTDVLERYVNFRFRIVSTSNNQVKIELEDGNELNLSRNLIQQRKLNRFIEDADQLFGPPHVPPPNPALPQAQNNTHFPHNDSQNPNNYHRNMRMLVSIAYNDDDDGLRYNEAITKDLTHIRELNITKRLYLMVKYLPASIIKKFSDINVTTMKPKPRWATRLSSQKNYLPELTQMLLRLIEIRQEGQAAQSARNDRERREQLWDIHRHLQMLMNQKGFVVHIEIPGRPKRLYKLPTISYPYYTRRTYKDQINNDHVFQVIFQAEPDAGIQYWNEEVRWKRACERPYRDANLVREIHSEYYNSHLPPGDDVLLSGSAFYDAIDNSTRLDAATQQPLNDHARVLPQMARAMMLQMDLFTDDTWNDMRLDYPDDFDPNWMNKCDSVANFDDTPMFRNATKDRYGQEDAMGVLQDIPAVLEYPKLSMTTQNLYRGCARWVRLLEKCDAKLQNLLHFSYAFLYAISNVGFTDPADRLPAYNAPANPPPGNALVYLNAIRQASPDNTEWLIRIPRESLMPFRIANGAPILNGAAIVDHVIDQPFLPKENGEPGFPGNWTVRTLITHVLGAGFVGNCTPLVAQANYLNHLIMRMRGTAADLAPNPQNLPNRLPNDTRRENIKKMSRSMSSFVLYSLEIQRDDALRVYNNFVQANPPGTPVPPDLTNARDQTQAAVAAFIHEPPAVPVHAAGSPVHVGFVHIRDLFDMASRWDRQDFDTLDDRIYSRPL